MLCAALLVLTKKQRWVWVCIGLVIFELALGLWWANWPIVGFALGFLLLLIQQAGTLRTGLATAFCGLVVSFQLFSVISFYRYYG